MRTTSAPTIKLKHYKAPAYTVLEVHLDVILDPEATQIRSTVKFERAKSTPADLPLVLDGDELKLSGLSVNGRKVKEAHYRASPNELVIHNLPKKKTFTVEILTELAPVKNKKLMGLYQSSGVFCTQCEAEGFRRITYFLDRPDVLAVYTVRLEADRKSCPVLLANGNPVEKGRLPQGRHFAVWHDPHPKPSYLFAIVGGDLDVHSDRFKTASGNKVKLNIYVETGKAEMASFAMDSLKRSMDWDERCYGREYDLDVFNIVAVSDFNMGAMENKGLNVFNDKFVLADPNVATDADYMRIEAIVAHEYFHNWTGNRITCRDWFQLCLKEGLTVYRDQEFSADERSRPVQRIQQVRGLKSGQFPEDAGPLAHSVRPAAYKEINNFYTATVYQKGAELVRMLATLVGPEAYRRSTDLYFERHDGEAAVVEDWLKCFEDICKIDLTRFARWYSQAGTPTLKVTESYRTRDHAYTLKFKQSTPITPGQPKKLPVPIPLRFGLMDQDGNPVTAQTDSRVVRDDLIIIDQEEVSVTFEGLAEKPEASLLQGFSAPVIVDFKQSEAALLLRAQHDPDLYNRWEAVNRMATKIILGYITPSAKIDALTTRRFIDILVQICFDDGLEPAIRAQCLTMPSVQDIVREVQKNVDPEAVYKAHRQLQFSIGRALGADAMALVAKLKRSISRQSDAVEAAGQRSLKNAMLPLLVLVKTPDALEFTELQFKNAKNMTDRMAALNVLLHFQTDASRSKDALDTFYERLKDDHLVVDKWFSVQATLPGTRGLRRIQSLTDHEAFTLENPNRARSLLGPFAAGNLTAFHSADGSGYTFFADQILAMDKINPQIAARSLTLMNNWKMFERKRVKLARAELERIAASPKLSKDTMEIVDRMLK